MDLSFWPGTPKDKDFQFTLKLGVEGTGASIWSEVTGLRIYYAETSSSPRELLQAFNKIELIGILNTGNVGVPIWGYMGKYLIYQIILDPDHQGISMELDSDITIPTRSIIMSRSSGSTIRDIIFPPDIVALPPGTTRTVVITASRYP